MTTVTQQEAAFCEFDPRLAWLMKPESLETADLDPDRPDSFAIGYADYNSLRRQQSIGVGNDFQRFAQQLNEVRDAIRPSLYATFCQGPITSTESPLDLSTFQPDMVSLEGISPIAAQELVEKGCLDDAQFTIKMAKQAFGSLQCIELTFDTDPEIPDWQTIRLAITVSASTSPDQVLEAERSFRERLHPAVSNEFYNLLTETYEWVSE